MALLLWLAVVGNWPSALGVAVSRRTNSPRAGSVVVTRRASGWCFGLAAAFANAPRRAAAAVPVGGLLPLVELRASISETQRDCEGGAIPAARARLLKTLENRELFRTIVAQNTQRSVIAEVVLADADLLSSEAKSAVAKRELQALRTADRVVRKLEASEIALSEAQKSRSASAPEALEQARASLAAARAGVEQLLELLAPQADVERAQLLFVELRRVDGDGDGIVDDAELATLPDALRRDAYDAEGVVATASALLPRRDGGASRLSGFAKVMVGVY